MLNDEKPFQLYQQSHLDTLESRKALSIRPIGVIEDEKSSRAHVVRKWRWSIYIYI